MFNKMNVILKYSLTIVFTFFMLDSLICQTKTIIIDEPKTIKAKPKIKFVDELNNPIPYLPVQITYSGAPTPMWFTTDINGSIPITFWDNIRPTQDGLYNCYIAVIYNEFYPLTETLTMSLDSITKEPTIIYDLKTMGQSKFKQERFENVIGKFSLLDLIIKDTLYLYNEYEVLNFKDINSIKFIKTSKRNFKVEIFGYYSYINKQSNKEDWTRQHVDLENIIKVKLCKKKLKIKINDTKLTFYIKALGNNYRYMLIRK